MVQLKKVTKKYHLNNFIIYQIAGSYYYYYNDQDPQFHYKELLKQTDIAVTRPVQIKDQAVLLHPDTKEQFSWFWSFPKKTVIQ